MPKETGACRRLCRNDGLILQHRTPDDSKLFNWESYSVREFIIKCCNNLGIELEFKNSIYVVGIIKSIQNKNYKINCITLTEVDKRYYRPSEVDYLIRDFQKAKVNYRVQNII